MLTPEEHRSIRDKEGIKELRREVQGVMRQGQFEPEKVTEQSPEWIRNAGAQEAGDVIYEAAYGGAMRRELKEIVEAEDADRSGDTVGLYAAGLPGAQRIQELYDPRKMEADDYAAAMDEAISIAEGVSSREAFERSDAAKALTKEQRDFAWEEGQRQRSEGIKRESSKAEPQEKKKAKKAGERPKQRKPGWSRLHYPKSATVDGIKLKGVTEDRIDKRTRDVISAFAEAANVEVIFYESEADSRGKYIGANGMYKDGVVYLDIHAAAKNQLQKDAMLLTLAHELVHHIRANAPAEYRALKEFVTEHLLNKGMDFETMVQNKLNQSDVKDREAAVEEVIADACEMVLKDSQAVQRMAAKDPNLAKRVFNFLRDWASKIKAAFEGIEARSAEAKAMTDAMDELVKLFDKALEAAGKNAKDSKYTPEKSAARQYTEQDVAKKGNKKAPTEGAKKSERSYYNPIREKLAKTKLDEISEKLGALFPLSAQFEEAIKEDITKLSKIKFKAYSNRRKKGESYWTAAQNSVVAAFPKGATVKIDQLELEAEITKEFAKESLSKLGHNADKQIILDLIPHVKELLEGSRLLAVERTSHNDNKKTSLLCYRLYNVYDRIEMDTSRKPVTRQHAVVFTVIQNVDDVNAYLVTDIKSIAVGKGRIAGNTSKSPHAKGNAHVDTIAQLYEIVKKIDRDDGGLKYSDAEKSSYIFDYTERNDGTKYSSRDSEGNELSAEQQEYFKDSKVRDEDGRLLVVYHGARDTGRTVFTRNVTYFTDDESMADSYSPNGGRYTGYLNITKPLEIDAKGSKWSAIPVPPEMEEILRNAGASTFMEDGVLCSTTGDIVAAIEEMVDEGEADYDGIIIRNVDDTGSYYKGKDKHIANDYVIFNSNQFKNIDNVKPTADKDIRFSMRDEVVSHVDPYSLETVNYITDQNKYQYLVDEFQENGYQGRPIVAIGEEGEESIALTGSHRIFAARRAGIDIPVVYIPYDAENELLQDLLSARGDDDRSYFAKKLLDSNYISEGVYQLIIREEELSFANRNIPYDKQIRYSQRDSSEGLTKEEAREQQKAYTRLKAENARLRDKYDYWKEQTKKTREKTVRKQDVEKMAKRLLKFYGSEGDRELIQARLQELGDKLVQGSGEILSYEELLAIAREVAVEIAENAVAYEDRAEAYGNPEEIASLIRSTKFYASPEMLRSLPEGFRKEYKNKLHLVPDKTARGVDSFYKEMQESYGYGLFPEEIVNEEDQILLIADAYDLLTAGPTEYNPFEHSMNEAVTSIAYDIMDRMLGEEVRQTPPTFADKAEARLQKEKAKGQAAVAKEKADKWERVEQEIANREDALVKLRADMEARIEQIKQQEKLKKQSAVAKEKAEKWKAVANLHKHYQDRIARQNAQRKENAASQKYRQRIYDKVDKLQRWLINNTDKERVPEGLKKPLIEFLAGLNLTSRRQLSGGEATKRDMRYEDRLRKLQDIVNRQQRYMEDPTNGDGLDVFLDLPNGFSEEIARHIENVQEILRGTDLDTTSPIVFMNSDQLSDLDFILTALSTSIKKINVFITESHFASVEEGSRQTREHLKEMGSAKGRSKLGDNVTKFLQWTNAEPIYIFKRFGMAGMERFIALADGWGQMAFNIQKVQDFSAKAYTEAEVQKWESTVLQPRGQVITKTKPGRNPRLFYYVETTYFYVKNYVKIC